VHKREANKDFVYKLSHVFFKESPQLTSKCFSLCKKAYLQQETMPGNYDDDSKELFVLIQTNEDSYFEYLNNYLDDKLHEHISGYKMLNKIWELSNCKKMVYESLVKISKINTSHKSEHLGCMFFYNLNEEYHEFAYEVFFNLIQDFHLKIEVINTVLDTLRNSIKQFYYPIICELITLNDDMNFFKCLEFNNNHFSTSSNEIWSEIRAKALSGILDAIQGLPNHYNFFHHKKYLMDEITLENNRTAWERKHRFRGFR